MPLLRTLALLALALGALAAAEGDPLPLDQATVDRAEAAADAFLSEDAAPAAQAPAAPAPEPVALDPEQREALSRVEVLQLELTGLLDAADALQASDRFLEVQALLETLPPLASDAGTRARLQAVRERQLQLGRELLGSGDFMLTAPEAPAKEPPDQP